MMRHATTASGAVDTRLTDTGPGEEWCISYGEDRHIESYGCEITTRRVLDGNGSGRRAWDLGSASGMETYFWFGGFEAGWILLMIPLIEPHFSSSVDVLSIVFHIDE